MGMSYKRAWLLLDSINQAFTEAVVTAAPGRSGGGGAAFGHAGCAVADRTMRREMLDAHRDFAGSSRPGGTWTPRACALIERYARLSSIQRVAGQCGSVAATL